MARKKVKKKKFKILLMFICSMGLTGLIILNLFSVLKEMDKKKDEKTNYEQQLTELEEESEYLNTLIIKLQDPDYIAKYAREQYLYSKDGEYNIRIN